MGLACAAGANISGVRKGLGTMVSLLEAEALLLASFES